MSEYDHSYWMKIALIEAEKALQEDEIPVAALLVKNDNLISKNHNRTRQLQDPLAHAEKLVVEEVIGSGAKFLNDYVLYVTLEPCTMCAGLLVLSRLGTLVIGADDPKSGAIGSLYNIALDKQLNHNISVVRGILTEDCSQILKNFFQNKRL